MRHWRLRAVYLAVGITWTFYSVLLVYQRAAPRSTHHTMACPEGQFVQHTALPRMCRKGSSTFLERKRKFRIHMSTSDGFIDRDNILLKVSANKDLDDRVFGDGYNHNEENAPEKWIFQRSNIFVEALLSKIPAPKPYNSTNSEQIMLGEAILVSEDHRWRSWPECLCGAPSDTECSPFHEPPQVRRLDHGAGGTCSWRAARYSSRNVISTVLYGSSSIYETKLKTLVRETAHLYPGWSVWVYQRHPHPQHVCSMLQNERRVFFCDTRHLPALGDLRRTSPLMWKVAPLGDPRVSAVLVRSVVSEPTAREAAAVLQWLESGKAWHVMRDHPAQAERVVEGHWCARWNDSSRHSMAALRNIILARSFSSLETKQVEKFAADVLWSHMESSRSLMQHDAFRCNETVPGTFEPWPSRRRGRSFVGMSKEPSELPECPAECRPPEHPEWTMC